VPAPDRTLRVGILGAGWVAGDRHVPAYRRHPAVELVAVYDHVRRSADSFADAHDIPFATHSLDAFLDYGLDLVSICTPPFAHHTEAVAALRAGCHVFLEKPMAMNVAEAEAIAGAARAAGRLLCVSHNFLFSRAMRRLRRVLDSGEAGAVRFVVGLQASSPHRRLPAWYGDLPAGLFFDESPHLLYLMGALLGDLRVVSATTTPGAPGSAQPVGSLHAALASERAPATLTMIFEAPLSEWHLIVVCRERVLLADLFRDISVVLGRDGEHKARDILTTSAAVGGQHLAGFLSSGARYTARRQHWGHQTLIHAMVDAVLRDGASPVPIEEALRVVRVTEDILRAAGAGNEHRQ
jgi:predicted dehydrogenase